MANNKNPNQKQPGEKEPGTFHYNPGNGPAKRSTSAKMNPNSGPTKIGYKAVTSNEIKSANRFRCQAGSDRKKHDAAGRCDANAKPISLVSWRPVGKKLGPALLSPIFLGWRRPRPLERRPARE
jgi:hypothetical protein